MTRGAGKQRGEEQRDLKREKGAGATQCITQLARTFNISTVANPPSYARSHGGALSGSAPGTGLFTSTLQQLPVEDPITAASTAGSSPRFWPSSIASAVTICWTPRTS